LDILYAKTLLAVAGLVFIFVFQCFLLLGTFKDAAKVT